MTPLLQVLLLFLCADTAFSEVNANFDRCKQEFFYKGKPPFVNYPGPDLTEKSICQKYENNYYFATLYSVEYRIPLYSAYNLPLGTCQGECYEFECFKWRVVCSPVRTQGCRKQQQGYLFHTNAIIPHKSSQQHTLGF